MAKARRSSARAATRSRPAGFVKAKDAAKRTRPRPAAAGKAGGERSDKGAPAKVAIERLPEPARAIARALDRLIRLCVPGCTASVKWGNAVYRTGDLAFAAIMETKRGVNLALPGAALSDPQGLLEGTGKVMRHVKMHSVAEVSRAGVRELIVAASEVGLKGM